MKKKDEDIELFMTIINDNEREKVFIFFAMKNYKLI